MSLNLAAILISFKLFGPDSITVYQKDALLFSNKYVFYSDGTFKHYYKTDDFQVWYGVGKYFDKGWKRMLKFEKADSTFKVEFGSIHYETDFERELVKQGRRFVSKDYYNTTNKEKVFFTTKK